MCSEYRGIPSLYWNTAVGDPSLSTNTMKTVEVHNAFGIDSLQVTDRPQPKPGPDEVLVKINSASLNYRDLMGRERRILSRSEFPIYSYLRRTSGEAIAAGEQVTRFEKGDRVTTHFIQDWEKGPFEQVYLGETYLATSLGIPGRGHTDRIYKSV